MVKTRVLHFCVGNGKGGRTQAMLENWRVIDKKKFQFGFVAIKDKLEFEESILESGGRVHYLSCTAEENEELFVSELKQIINEGYDIVHIHMAVWKKSLVEKVASDCHIKEIILHSHNTEVSRIEDEVEMERVRQEHNCVKNTLEIAPNTKYWACSEAAADWLFGEQIPKEKIVIVKDSIDSNRFQYNETKRRELRQKYELDGKFVIGHIGRFSYQKNQEFLIEVLKNIVADIPNAVLLFEGVGKQKQQVIDKAEEYGLLEKIIFFEKYENIEELYQVMDFFAFPSRFEGFGRVLLEAQCAGLHCITSTYVPRDVEITDKITFQELDVEDWVQYIKLHGEYDRRDGSDEVRASGYDLEDNVRQLEQLYMEGL